MWKTAINPLISPNTPIEELKDVGEARAKILRNNEIATLADILLDFPKRYIHRKTAVPISTVEEGTFTTILGLVRGVSFNRKGRTGTLTVNVCDESGKARLIFFKSPGWRAAQFELGKEVLIWGDTIFRDGKLEFHHPDYEFSSEGDSRVIPVYRVLEDDEGGKIGQILHSKLVKNALDFVKFAPDLIPEDILRQIGLSGLRETIERLHFPKCYADVENARSRLAFDEMFLLQTIFAKRRFEAHNDKSTPIVTPSKKFAAVKRNLPFELTHGQNEALSAIVENLASPGRSSILLSGDVGSGKTVLAMLAAVATADSGCQSALIVPSLLVARQHADTIANLANCAGIRVGLLTGESQSDELRRALKCGDIDIVVGTQALLSEHLAFKKLGLVIIDEQHLMGVLQRLELPKREGAHVIMLSATPIPRSTALALFGDLDLVELREYPKTRTGTRTYLRGESARNAVWDFIEGRISAGERAFVVYPRIEGEDFSALEFGFGKLCERFGDKVGFVHGGLDERDKHKAIEAFRTGNTPILSATTVISVGIDVPEATVMLVEHADRFGLAQLHQLRGRVGRAEKAGYCILMCTTPRESRSLKRLKSLASTKDGFEIAKIDLEERREGELLNIAQSGKNNLCFADPIKMPELVETARNAALEVIKEDPLLKLHKNTGLKRSLDYIYCAGVVVEFGA